jgi:hypothetical protein
MKDRVELFAKRFSKRLLLHQRNRFTGGAGAKTVFRGTGALPNIPSIYTCKYAMIKSFVSPTVTCSFIGHERGHSGHRIRWQLTTRA